MILIVTDEERGLRPEEHHQLQPPHRHHHQPKRQHLNKNQLVIQLNFKKKSINFSVLQSDNNNSTTPKRRGRPPKNVNSAGGNQEVNNQEAVESESAELTSQVTDANETGLQPTEAIVNNNNSTANEVDAHKEVQPSDKGASNEEQVEPTPQQSQNDIVEPKPNLNSDDTSTPQPVEAN